MNLHARCFLVLVVALGGMTGAGSSSYPPRGRSGLTVGGQGSESMVLVNDGAQLRVIDCEKSAFLPATVIGEPPGRGRPSFGAVGSWSRFPAEDSGEGRLIGLAAYWDSAGSWLLSWSPGDLQCVLQPLTDRVATDIRILQCATPALEPPLIAVWGSSQAFAVFSGEISERGIDVSVRLERGSPVRSEDESRVSALPVCAIGVGPVGEYRYLLLSEETQEHGGREMYLEVCDSDWEVNKRSRLDVSGLSGNSLDYSELLWIGGESQTLVFACHGNSGSTVYCVSIEGELLWKSSSGGSRRQVSVLVVDDLTEDGIPEVCWALPDANPSGEQKGIAMAGQLRLMCGRTGELIRAWAGASGTSRFAAGMCRSARPGSTAVWLSDQSIDDDAGGLLLLDLSSGEIQDRVSLRRCPLVWRVGMGLQAAGWHQGGEMLAVGCSDLRFRPVEGATLQLVDVAAGACCGGVTAEDLFEGTEKEKEGAK